MANRYWVGGVGDWGDPGSHWATSTGGSPGGGNGPSSTDDVFIDTNSGLVDSDTIGAGTGTYLEINNITCSTGLSAYTINAALLINGNATFEAGSTVAVTTFQPVAAGKTITTGGCTFSVGELLFQPSSSSYSSVLQGDLILSNGNVKITKGGFDANDYNVTANNIYLQNFDQSAACTTITMGSGTWTCLTGTFDIQDTYPDTDTNSILDHTGITITCETSTVKLKPDFNGASYATGTFGCQYGGGPNGKTYYKLELYSSYESTEFNIYGGGTFNEIKATPNAHAMTVRFAGNYSWANPTKVTTWTVSGSSGKLITVNSTGSPAPFYLWKSTGNVSSDYLDLSDSYAINYAINQSHFALDETGDMGYTGVNEKVGQSFTPNVTGDIHSWVMYLAAVGTPVDALRIKIYTNSAGAPNTLLATSSNTIDPSGAAYGYCKFDFAAGTSLTSSTKYWAVLERTGSTSTTNYWNFYRSSASGYAGGEAIKYSGSAWSSDTGDWYFQYNIRSAGAAWYAGTHSNDTSNNEGWVFSAPLTTTTKTITGTARITATTTKTIAGVSKVSLNVTKTITGKARISGKSTLSPGTMADDSAVGTVAWITPDNAKTSNNTRTTASIDGLKTSHYLKATNFGFAIPAGATIDGILVEIEKRRHSDV